MPPTELAADPLEQFKDSDSRYYIIQNVKDISEAVVRGKNAGGKLEVFIYRVHSVVMGVLGTAGGGGITAGWSVPDASVLGYTIGIASLASAAGLEVYNQLKIEERATQALKVRDAFALLSANMGVALKSAEPDDTLAALSKTADALISTFYKVIPDLTGPLEQEALASARDLVVKFSNRWLAKTVSKGGRSLT